MLFFAQSQWTAPTGTATWLGVLAFLLIIFNQGRKALAGLKDTPHPGDVQRESAERYVAKTEFQNHVEWNRREHENLFSKMGGIERGGMARVESLSREWREVVDTKMAELLASSDQGREKLHDRINDVLEAVSELRGQVKEMAKLK